MKYMPYLSGFMLGFTFSSILWMSYISSSQKHNLLDHSKQICSSLGFNSFNIDEHGNVFCKNVMKND